MELRSMPVASRTRLIDVNGNLEVIQLIRVETLVWRPESICSSVRGSSICSTVEWREKRSKREVGKSISEESSEEV